MMKLKLMLLGGVALVAIVAGAWMYVNHLQSENEILTANNAQLDDALEREKQTTAQLTADSVFKDNQLLKRQDQLVKLGEVNAKLKGELRETVKEDPVVTECLGVVPGDDFINRLREYSEGQSRDRSAADVPEPVVLSEED